MFGERLKKVVNELQYSGNEFAAKAGLGGSQIHQILRGSILPRVKLCLDIHKAFPEINWDYMITGRGSTFLPEDELETGLSGMEIPSIMEISPKVRETQESYGNYKELYEQCLKLVNTKDMLIEMQAKRISELENRENCNDHKKNRKTG